MLATEGSAPGAGGVRRGRARGRATCAGKRGVGSGEDREGSGEDRQRGRGGEGSGGLGERRRRGAPSAARAWAGGRREAQQRGLEALAGWAAGSF